LSIAKIIRETEALSKANLAKLALISAFLTSLDTVQSYYLQHVVDVFNEANLIPRFFYSYGVVGYVVYAPIEFLAIYQIMLVLWLWASYVIWYYKYMSARRSQQIISSEIR
jgi:hypothetical protein